MNVILACDCKQASDNWWMARQGVATASDFDSILTARGKRCPLLAGHAGPHLIAGDGKKPGDQLRCPVWLPTLSAGRHKYIAGKIADIIWGSRPPYFSDRGRPVNTVAMQNGRDTENEAREWLRLETDLKITEVGFVLDDDLKFGCSPDGLIDFQLGERVGDWRGLPLWHATAAGALELKCPLLETHIGYVQAGTLPLKYTQQTHGEMVVCGVPYTLFCSYAHGPVAPLQVPVPVTEYTGHLRNALADFDRLFEVAKAKFLPQGAAL